MSGILQSLITLGFVLWILSLLTGLPLLRSALRLTGTIFLAIALIIVALTAYFVAILTIIIVLAVIGGALHLGSGHHRHR